MREEILKRFFLGQIPADQLWADIRESVRYETVDGLPTCDIEIEDLTEPFRISREQAVALCDSVIGGALPPAALMPIGFALMASDAFEWEDELLSEVIADWSCPEVNYPLNTANIERFKRWLTGAEPYPERPPLQPESQEKGRVILVTRKTTPKK